MKRCFDPTDCYDSWQLPPLKIVHHEAPVKELLEAPRPVERASPILGDSFLESEPVVRARTPILNDSFLPSEPVVRARTPSPILNDNARAFLESMQQEPVVRARTPSPILNDNARLFLQLTQAPMVVDLETVQTPNHRPMLRDVSHAGLLREDGGIKKTQRF
jgi:hypothetical protein